MTIDIVFPLLLVVFVAYLIFGITGFGAAMIAVPLLVQFIPLKIAVPIIVILDIICTTLVAGKNWRNVSFVDMKLLLPWMFIGIILGATLLSKLNSNYFLIFLGVFIVAISIKELKKYNLSSENYSNYHPLPFGVVGGVFSSLFGTGGPVYTIYLSQKIKIIDKFRATIAFVILLSGLIRLSAFSFNGLYSDEYTIYICMLSIPAALFGLLVGSKIRNNFDDLLLRKYIYILLFVSGILVIYRGVKLSLSIV